MGTETVLATIMCLEPAPMCSLHGKYLYSHFIDGSMRH